MSPDVFKRIFLEQKRTKGFCAPRNLFLVLNFLISNYGTRIRRASLRRQIKAKWHIDKRENTIRASIRDLQKIGLATLSTERPVLVNLDLHRFALLLTHYYVKTSDRRIFTEILKKLMPGYGHFLSNTQAFEKNSLRQFYLYIDPFPLEWIIETIKKRSITQPIRELIDHVMERPIEAAIVPLLLTTLFYLKWHPPVYALPLLVASLSVFAVAWLRKVRLPESLRMK
jgi:hypothetical protein